MNAALRIPVQIRYFWCIAIIHYRAVCAYNTCRTILRNRRLMQFCGCVQLPFFLKMEWTNVGIYNIALSKIISKFTGDIIKEYIFTFPSATTIKASVSLRKYELQRPLKKFVE